MARGRVRRAYVAFRSSSGFVWILTLLWVGWVSWNWLLPSLRFDQYPFILLNLLLSVEAAYAMPVFLQEQSKTDMQRAKEVQKVLAFLAELKVEKNNE